MPPGDQLHSAANRSEFSGNRSESTAFDRLLRALSVFTMGMTLPQAWAVWRGSDVGGVSLVSWATYLLACLRLVYGLRKRDPPIYLACTGWIVLDAAIVLGVLAHR